MPATSCRSNVATTTDMAEVAHRNAATIIGSSSFGRQDQPAVCAYHSATCCWAITVVLSDHGYCPLCIS